MIWDKSWVLNTVRASNSLWLMPKGRWTREAMNGKASYTSRVITRAYALRRITANAFWAIAFVNRNVAAKFIASTNILVANVKKPVNAIKMQNYWTVLELSAKIGRKTSPVFVLSITENVIPIDAPAVAESKISIKPIKEPSALPRAQNTQSPRKRGPKSMRQISWALSNARAWTQGFTFRPRSSWHQAISAAK